MQAIWNRIEDTVERIDNYTYGAAEMLLVMTLGSIVATTFYAILSVVVMGYIEIFNLISGSF